MCHDHHHLHICSFKFTIHNYSHITFFSSTVDVLPLSIIWALVAVHVLYFVTLTAKEWCCPKKHSEQHAFCFYSYTCDEFVVNDTQCGLLERVRQDWFHTVNSNPTEDNDCHVAEDDQESWKEIQENVRTLRPRSRKRYSVDTLSSMKCLYTLFTYFLSLNFY